MITRRRALELTVPALALGIMPGSLRSRQVGGQLTKETIRLNVWRHARNNGCCAPWVQELRDAGFAIEMERTGDARELREELGVPEDLWCCHTAVMEGYIVEGHVPVEDILRLLRQRPLMAGLAAPGYLGENGMPRTEGSFEVVAFWRDGMRSIFSTHYLGG